MGWRRVISAANADTSPRKLQSSSFVSTSGMRAKKRASRDFTERLLINSNARKGTKEREGPLRGFDLPSRVPWNDQNKFFAQ